MTSEANPNNPASTENPQEQADSDRPRRGPSPVLLVMLVIPLAGIFIALLMIASNPGSTTQSQADRFFFTETDGGTLVPSVINYTAPDFELTDLNGEPVRLSDYLGRPVMLNFWQTTCAPCRQEMPELQNFIKDQGEDGIVVLTVNFDETADMVEAFFDEINVRDVPVLMDKDSRVRNAYGVQAIPVTFVIDREGTVQGMKLGAMTIDDMENYAAMVDAG